MIMRWPMSRRLMLIGCLDLVVREALAQSSRVWRIAYLGSGRTSVTVPVMKRTLLPLGYEEGKNLIFDVREAHGHYDELPALMQQLLALHPDVIVAEATPAVAAAQKATSSIPIVMAPASDPVGSGFVQSLARPGGNITGVANMFGDLTTKTLDIIRRAFPGVKKIGVLSSNNPTHPALVQVTRDAARTVGIVVDGFVAANPEDMDRAFSDMKSAGCEVAYVLADPVRPALPAVALKHGMPSVYQVNSYVEIDGLMSYGPDLPSMFVKAAQYVDRILKGGKPAEIPVEQPTEFVLAVNLRTARKLGLSIPEQLLLMADKVIE